MMTFSLSPMSRSILPSSAASVSTFVVSWKEAAERNESVVSEAFVIPRMIVLELGRLAARLRRPALHARANSKRSTNWPGQESVSPFWSTRTFFSIWRTISSMCLSLMSTPWDL